MGNPISSIVGLIMFIILLVVLLKVLGVAF